MKEVELMEVEYVRELVSMIEKNKSFEKEIRDDPAKAIAKIAKTKSPLKVSEDIGIYRIVVLMLGIAILLAVSRGIILAITDSTKDMPDILVATAATAVGALAGLLAPTTSSGK